MHTDGDTLELSNAHTHTQHQYMQTHWHCVCCTHEGCCAFMHTDANTNTDVGRVKHTPTHTHTSPISNPDGGRAAADVTGRALGTGNMSSTAGAG